MALTDETEVTALREEVVRLRAELAALREQVGTTGIRLGPQPETEQVKRERMSRMTEAITGLKLTGPPPPVDRTATCTTSGEPPEKVRAEQTERTGQHKAYIVLCDDERAKGFTRPYRDRYRHTKCGGVTTMGIKLSETYARDPGFYGATFCCACNAHFPVAEFTWTADGQVVGS